MNRPLHNEPHEFVSADQGWQQMHALLEKHLPIKKERKKWLFSYAICAALLSVFMFAGLRINDRLLPEAENINFITRQQHQYIPHVYNQPVAENITENNSSATTDSNYSQKSSLQYVDINKDVAYSYYITAVGLASTRDEHFFEGYIAGHEPLPRNQTGSSLIKIKSGADSPGVILKGRPTKSSWEFAAGLGVNIKVPGKKQHFQPYPVARVSYIGGRNFYLTAGAALPSPVAVDQQGISKTVYLNDTSNNVRLYNNVKEYKRLYYLDLPLMAGKKIGKHISIEAGLQASLIISAKKSTTIQPYDFQMNPAPGNMPSATAITGVPAEDYQVGVKKTELRFIAGAAYKMDNIAFGIHCQSAATNALKGKYVSADKNKLVNLSLLYTFKKRK